MKQMKLKMMPTDEKMVDWKDIRSGVVHVVMQHSDDWFGNASRANLRKVKNGETSMMITKIGNFDDCSIHFLKFAV
jgi:hypothetical protein